MPKTSKYGPEVYELCLKMYETQSISHDDIAQHLYDNGIVDTVVHRSTILRWCDKAVGDTDKARTRRQRVEENIAAADLDKARKMAYDLSDEVDADEVDVAVIEAKIKVLNAHLAMRRERSRTYGTDAPKRKEVVVTTTEIGGVSRKELSKKGEYNQADFEAWVKARRNGQRATEDAD